MLCTLEGPPVWRGRIELVDGCLLLREESGAESRALVMLPSPAIYRDAEGYLAISSGIMSAETTVRVGESGVVATGHGCSRPNFLPAPAGLAATCGTARVINLARVARVPVCSSGEIARLEQARRDHAETAARVRRQHEACLAGGNRTEACPPPVIPYPIELHQPGCRMPGDGTAAPGL